MIGGLFLILLCQLLGEVVAKATGIPVPGPVLGMIFFFVFLLLRNPGEQSGEVQAGDALLRFMPLFFVPAGAGIVVYLPQLLAEWMPVTLGLVLSWFVTLLVTAGAAVLLRPRRPGREEAA